MTLSRPQETVSSPDQVVADHRRHVFHSWSAQSNLAEPLVLTGGQGSYVVDAAGRRYLDFASQLVFANIGHQHPRVVEAICAQVERLCTVAPQHASAPRSDAARMIAELAPGDLDRVFFTTGGTEAVEHAARMARLHTGRFKLLSAYRSYHGATTTSINLTGDPRRWPSDHGSAGVSHFFGPFLYRSPFGSSTEAEEAERALDHLEQVVTMEGPSLIAAIVIETVPGNPGIMPPPPGYLRGVRDLCDRHGIVYVADEVMCGFGRTGRWFAVEHFDVVPDLLTFAKGVNSGYVPLGGVLISERIAATFSERPYPGGLTYSGHPVACAAAVATIQTMADERIVENTAAIGEQCLGPGLQALAARHRSVGEARGLGVFWALELVSHPERRTPMAPYGGTSDTMKQVAAICAENGLLVLTVHNRIHVVPPCTVTPEEVEQAMAVLDRALEVADRSVEG